MNATQRNFNYELLYNTEFLNGLSESDRELFEEIGPENVADHLRKLSEYEVREEVARLSVERANSEQLYHFSEMMSVLPGSYYSGELVAYRDKDELRLVKAAVQRERNNRWSDKYADKKAETEQF